MAKLTLTDISAGYDTASITSANNTLIEAAVENTLSRDGTSPNQMESGLDMNGYRITNLVTAVNNSEPVTLGQAASLAGVTNPLTQDTVGAVLYPRTTAETSAGVTPTNYYYPSGDVRRYGATGNGSTDDAASIQDAISSAPSGGAVYFPAGTYSVSEPILGTSSELTLYGEPGTIIKPDASFDTETDHSNKGVIHLEGVSYWVIRDLTIDCASAVSASGVKLLTVDESRVTGVTVLSPPSTTVSSGYGVFIFGQSRRNIVSNCHVSSAGYSSYDCAESGGVQPDSNTFISNVSVSPTINAFDIYRTLRTTIADNTCIGGTGTDAAIRLTGGTSGLPNRGCIVSNNTIDNTPSNGIVCINVTKDCVISGNEIGSVTKNGIILSGSDVVNINVTGNSVYSPTISGIECSGTRCAISSNVVRECGLHGIYLNTATYCSVTDNYSELADQDGFRLLDSDDCILSGNFSIDCSQETTNTYSGFNLITSDANFITKNIARETGLAARPKRGMAITSGTTNVVTGNDLTSSGQTGTFVDAGTTTVVRDNEPTVNQTYTETNVSTDRAFNADTVVVAELADVVGTLIVDLRAKGLVD